MDGTNYARADNDVIRVFIYSIKSFEIRIFHLYINIRWWRQWVLIIAVFFNTSVHTPKKASLDLLSGQWLHRVRLKKKDFVSNLARIFQTDAACGFLFSILFFLLQLAFASTHIRNQKWLKSFNFHIFRNQRGFYTFFELPRAYILPKQQTFFVFRSKNEKKIYNFKKKKMKVWILQNQMRTEKQMRAAALRHRIFFFFSLKTTNLHAHACGLFILAHVHASVLYLLVRFSRWGKQFRADFNPGGGT